MAMQSVLHVASPNDLDYLARELYAAYTANVLGAGVKWNRAYVEWENAGYPEGGMDDFERDAERDELQTLATVTGFVRYITTKTVSVVAAQFQIGNRLFTSAYPYDRVVGKAIDVMVNSVGVVEGDKAARYASHEGQEALRLVRATHDLVSRLAERDA